MVTEFLCHPRVLFYSFDEFGVGHISIIVSVQCLRPMSLSPSNVEYGLELFVGEVVLVAVLRSQLREADYHEWSLSVSVFRFLHVCHWLEGMMMLFLLRSTESARLSRKGGVARRVTRKDGAAVWSVAVHGGQPLEADFSYVFRVYYNHHHHHH